MLCLTPFNHDLLNPFPETLNPALLSANLPYACPVKVYPACPVWKYDCIMVQSLPRLAYKEALSYQGKMGTIFHWGAIQNVIFPNPKSAIRNPKFLLLSALCASSEAPHLLIFLDHFFLDI